MALIVNNVNRIFKHDNNVLADPNPSMSPEEVLSFYSNQYPQLVTSTVVGPTFVDDANVEYDFKSVVGTKG